MKYALISPLEARAVGFRVADVCESTFEVAEPFFWVKCPNTIVADLFWYDPTDEQCKSLEEYNAQVAANSQPVVSGAQTL